VPRKRLLWHLLPWYLAAAALCLAGLIVYAGRSYTTFYVRQRERDLAALARVTAFEIADRTHGSLDGPEALATLESLCRDLGRGANARLTVVDPAGRVLCDSEKDPASLENHRDRPEIRDALAGGTGTAVRFSSTLEEDLLYVAVPFPHRGARGPCATPSPSPRSATPSPACAATWSSGAGRARARGDRQRPARPAPRAAGARTAGRRGALRRGDFSQALPIPAFAELAVIAEEMNRMASQLDERIRGEVRQRRELEAVLSSMVEGVLAFDPEANLISLNAAAGACSACAPSKSGAGASRRRSATRSCRSSSRSRSPRPACRSGRSPSSTTPASGSSRPTAPGSPTPAATASARSSCSTTSRASGGWSGCAGTSSPTHRTRSAPR